MCVFIIDNTRFIELLTKMPLPGSSHDEQIYGMLQKEKGCKAWT